MPAATKIGDNTVGTCDIGQLCCPHSRSGTNSSGSSDVYINSNPAHRVDDTGNCNCPHSGSFKSIAGSSTVFINGKAATRIGDTTQCINCGQLGNHSSGSSNVYIG